MEKLNITPEEKERVQTFIYEQKEAWNQAERAKMFSAQLQGVEYQPADFPGFDEATALQAVRNGWKSKLDKLFEAKRRREGW